MNRWLILALIACCATLPAQQPEPEKGEGGPPQAAAAATGIASADTGKDTEEGAPEDTEEDAAADTEADVATAEAEEDAGEPDEEFKPSEEIPEDYPVPLPSDI